MDAETLVADAVQAVLETPPPLGCTRAEAMYNAVLHALVTSRALHTASNLVSQLRV